MQRPAFKSANADSMESNWNVDKLEFTTTILQTSRLNIFTFTYCNSFVPLNFNVMVCSAVVTAKAWDQFPMLRLTQYQ